MIRLGTFKALFDAASVRAKPFRDAISGGLRGGTSAAAGAIDIVGSLGTQALFAGGLLIGAKAAEKLDKVSDVTARILRSEFVNDVLLPTMNEEDVLRFADALEGLDSTARDNAQEAFAALSVAGQLQREAGMVAMFAGAQAGVVQARGEKGSAEWEMLDAMSSSDWKRALELHETGDYKLDAGELEAIQRYAAEDVNVPGILTFAKQPGPGALLVPIASGLELAGIVAKQKANQVVDDVQDTVDDVREDDGDGEDSMPPVPEPPDTDPGIDEAARDRIISAVVILTASMGAAAAVTTVIGMVSAGGGSLAAAGLTREMLMQIARDREAELASEKDEESEPSEGSEDSEEEPAPEEEPAEGDSDGEQTSPDPGPGYGDEPVAST